jgi:hypothetical protein
MHMWQQCYMEGSIHPALTHAFGKRGRSAFGLIKHQCIIGLIGQINATVSTLPHPGEVAGGFNQFPEAMYCATFDRNACKSSPCTRVQLSNGPKDVLIHVLLGAGGAMGQIAPPTVTA